VKDQESTTTLTGFIGTRCESSGYADEVRYGRVELLLDRLAPGNRVPVAEDCDPTHRGRVELLLDRPTPGNSCACRAAAAEYLGPDPTMVYNALS